jgi:hypothetical protein
MAVEQAAHPAPSGWKDAPRKRSLNGASYTVAGGWVARCPVGQVGGCGSLIDYTRALRRGWGGDTVMLRIKRTQGFEWCLRCLRCLRRNEPEARARCARQQSVFRPGLARRSEDGPWLLGRRLAAVTHPSRHSLTAPISQSSMGKTRSNQARARPCCSQSRVGSLPAYYVGKRYVARGW